MGINRFDKPMGMQVINTYDRAPYEELMKSEQAKAMANAAALKSAQDLGIDLKYLKPQEDVALEKINYFRDKTSSLTDKFMKEGVTPELAMDIVKANREKQEFMSPGGAGYGINQSYNVYQDFVKQGNKLHPDWGQKRIEEWAGKQVNKWAENKEILEDPAKNVLNIPGLSKYVDTQKWLSDNLKDVDWDQVSGVTGLSEKVKNAIQQGDVERAFAEIKTQVKSPEKIAAALGMGASGSTELKDFLRDSAVLSGLDPEAESRVYDPTAFKETYGFDPTTTFGKQVLGKITGAQFTRKDQDVKIREDSIAAQTAKKKIEDSLPLIDFRGTGFSIIDPVLKEKGLNGIKEKSQELNNEIGKFQGLLDQAITPVEKKTYEGKLMHLNMMKSYYDSTANTVKDKVLKQVSGEDKQFLESIEEGLFEPYNVTDETLSSLIREQMPNLTGTILPNGESVYVDPVTNSQLSPAEAFSQAFNTKYGEAAWGKYRRLYDKMEDKIKTNLEEVSKSYQPEFSTFPSTTTQKSLENILPVGSFHYLTEEGPIEGTDSPNPLDIKLKGFSKQPIDGLGIAFSGVDTNKDSKTYGKVFTVVPSLQDATTERIGLEIINQINPLSGREMTQSEKEQFEVGVMMINPQMRSIGNQISSIHAGTGKKEIIVGNSTPFSLQKEQIKDTDSYQWVLRPKDVNLTVGGEQREAIYYGDTQELLRHVSLIIGNLQ